MGQTLRINEIFYSIQGETTRMGSACVFVRLSGCHLRCSYCDTEYSFREGETRQVGEIVEEVLGYPCRYVTVTGGEPLLQERVHVLMKELCDARCDVALETSGACDISMCDPRVVRILDIKTPSSGEHERMEWSNIDALTGRDEVKLVIGDRGDYEFAVGVLREHELCDRVGAVLFSPVFEQASGLEIAGHRGLAMRTLAEWILEDGLGVVLQPQLHKFIWDPSARGV
ncbi:MAG: radical SAM protein [Planctomycetota bacterium]|jgi:7-carboxy-7-deazaguanine synthase